MDAASLQKVKGQMHSFAMGEAMAQAARDYQKVGHRAGHEWMCLSFDWAWELGPPPVIWVGPSQRARLRASSRAHRAPHATP